MHESSPLDELFVTAVQLSTEIYLFLRIAHDDVIETFLCTGPSWDWRSRICDRYVAGRRHYAVFFFMARIVRRQVRSDHPLLGRRHSSRNCL